jgi:hypothetical protein
MVPTPVLVLRKSARRASGVARELAFMLIVYYPE